LITEVRDERRIAAVGTVRDHLVRALARQVQDRQAIDVDAHGLQVLGDQARVEARRAARRLRVDGIERAEPYGGRCIAPLGRPQSLDPAAFLVDQHRRLRPADAGAQLGYQVPQLLGRPAVAREDDKA
jgi:hypothetical protein